MGYVWGNSVMSYETHIINGLRMGKSAMRYKTHIINGLRMREGCNESRNTYH